MTEYFDLQNEEGRTVAVWRDAPADGARGPVVVMAPGYGQRMRSGGVMALWLLRNGATVYRFDSLDHVGLSAGEIRQYSLLALHSALSTVVSYVRGREQVRDVSFLATSLAALPVAQYAATAKCADNVVLVLGVVNGRQTLVQVLGVDYLDWDLDALPAHFVIEKHEVDPRPIVAEQRVIPWWNMSSMIDALSVLNVPVRNFVAADDDWVDINDVRASFVAANLDPLQSIVEVPVSGHALLRNPVALKAMLSDVTRALVPDTGPLVMPSFEDIVALRGAERDLEREHRASRSADADRRVDAGSRGVDS